MSAARDHIDFQAPTAHDMRLEYDPIARWSARRAGMIIAASRTLAARNVDREKVTIAGVQEPVPQLPEYAPTQPRAESFTALQEWEGEVTSIKGDTFSARLIDVTAGEKVANEAVEGLLIEDLQEEDLPRLREGAIFRWVIGYAKTSAGTKTRGSRIYFRRVAPRRHNRAPDLDFAG